MDKSVNWPIAQLCKLSSQLNCVRILIDLNLVAMSFTNSTIMQITCYFHRMRVGSQLNLNANKMLAIHSRANDSEYARCAARWLTANKTWFAKQHEIRKRDTRTYHRTYGTRRLTHGETGRERSLNNIPCKSIKINYKTYFSCRQQSVE